MDHQQDFTRGSVLPKLMRFMLPILGALILQAMYSAVALLCVVYYLRGKKIRTTIA